MCLAYILLEEVQKQEGLHSTHFLFHSFLQQKKKKRIRIPGVNWVTEKMPFCLINGELPVHIKYKSLSSAKSYWLIWRKQNKQISNN